MAEYDFEGDSLGFIKEYCIAESLLAHGLERKKVTGNLNLERVQQARVIICGTDICDNLLMAGANIAEVHLLDVAVSHIDLRGAVLGRLILDQIRRFSRVTTGGNINLEGAAIGRIHCINNTTLAEEMARALPTTPISAHPPLKL